jgi:hypothetical protein
VEMLVGYDRDVSVASQNRWTTNADRLAIHRSEMCFCHDDHCLEAAASGSAKPSSRQLGDWFWNETAAGATIHALRAACLASADERLKLIAGNFMVPAARVRSTG